MGTFFLDVIRPALRCLPRGAGTFYRLAGGQSTSNCWPEDGTRVTRGVDHGLKMRLRLDNPVERESYYLGRFYEWELQAVLDKWLNPGDTFIDVGANIGMVTLAAAARVGAGGLILAFEPNPEARERLVDHVKMNNLGQVRVLANGLGEAVSTASLSVAADHSGTGTLRPSGSGPQSYTVSVARLDDFLGEIPRERSVFVKIDTEGYDFCVLKGAKGLLSGPNVIVFAEVNDKWLKELGQSAEEMIAYMDGLGFKAFYPRLEARGLRRTLKLEPLVLPGPHHWFNALFLRPAPAP